MRTGAGGRATSSRFEDVPLPLEDLPEPEVRHREPTLSATVDAAEVASLLGVTVSTVWKYNGRGTADRRDGTVTASTMPAPERLVGRSPLWNRKTIHQWIGRRPGAGRKAEELKS